MNVSVISIRSEAPGRYLVDLLSEGTSRTLTVKVQTEEGLFALNSDDQELWSIFKDWTKGPSRLFDLVLKAHLGEQLSFPCNLDKATEKSKVSE